MPQTYIFTSPDGDEIEVDSPDGRLPSADQLRQMFAQNAPVPEWKKQIAEQPASALRGALSHPLDTAMQVGGDALDILTGLPGKAKEALDLGVGALADRYLPSEPAGLSNGNETGKLLEPFGLTGQVRRSLDPLAMSHPELAGVLSGVKRLGERGAGAAADPTSYLAFGPAGVGFLPGMVKGSVNSLLNLGEEYDKWRGGQGDPNALGETSADALFDTGMATAAALHPAGEIAGKLSPPKAPLPADLPPLVDTGQAASDAAEIQKWDRMSPREQAKDIKPASVLEEQRRKSTEQATRPIPGAEPFSPEGLPVEDYQTPKPVPDFEKEFPQRAENATQALIAELSPHPVVERLVASYHKARELTQSLFSQGLLSKKAAEGKVRLAQASLVTSLSKLKEKLQSGAGEQFKEMYFPERDSGSLEEQHAKVSPISSEENAPRSKSALLQMVDLNEALGHPLPAGKIKGSADTTATLRMRAEDEGLSSFNVEIPERAGAPNTLSAKLAEHLINGVINNLPRQWSDQVRNAVQTLIKTGRFAHMEPADPTASIRGMTLADPVTEQKEIFIQPGEIGRTGMRGVSGHPKITFIKNFIRTVAHEMAHAVDYTGTQHGTVEGEAARLALETELIDLMENSPLGQGLINTVTEEGSFANEFAKGFNGRAGKQLRAAVALGGEEALAPQPQGLIRTEGVPSEASAVRGLPERVKGEERKKPTEETEFPLDSGEAQLFPWEERTPGAQHAPTYTSNGKVITTLRTARLNTFAHEIVQGVESGAIPRDYASIREAAAARLGKRGLRSRDVADAVAQHLGIMTPQSGAITSRVLSGLAERLKNPGKLINDLAEGGLALGASGYLTAMNNTLNSFVDNGSKGLADLISFLPGYKRAMKAVSGISINPDVAAGHLKGTFTRALNPASLLRDASAGAATFVNKQGSLPARMTRESTAAIDLTSAGLDPKLFNRIWHYTTSGQHVGLSPQGAGPSLTFAQRVTQSALALNLIGDYTHFMATFGKEMVPLLEAHGVDSLAAFRDKLKADPTLLDQSMKDQIMYAATEAMANTAKLGAAGMKRKEGERSIAAMSRDMSDILSKYPAVQFLSIKYSNYLLNNFLPGIMDSMPTALVGKGLLASKRTKNSLEYEGLKKDALAAMNQASAMKAAKDPGLQAFVKGTLQPLKLRVKHLQETGVYSQQRVARQAAVGPMVAGLWFLLGMTTQDPEEPWDKLKVAPQGEGGGKVKESLIGALGAASPFAYLGYRAAQRLRNVPDAKGKEGFANYAADLQNVVGARLGDFPTIIDLFNSKDVPLDTLYKKVQRYASDMGKLATKSWQFDLARGVAEKVSPAERVERNPNVAPKGLPSGGDILLDTPINFLRGALSGVPGVRENFPPKYDPSTGRPQSIEGGFGLPGLPDPMLRNQNFSPLREFLDQNQNLISPKDVYMSQTGSRDFDKAAFAYVEKQIPRRILPLLAKKESKPRDVLIAEVKKEMGRINDEARETAEKAAAREHWMLPPEIIRKSLNEKERERLERASGTLRRPPNPSTNLSPGDKARLRRLAEEQGAE